MLRIMKTRVSGDPEAPAKPTSLPDPREVDRLYGLEPVFEPDAESGRQLGDFVQLQCPWCGETFGSAVDLTTGDRTWIEDCQVCCRPIRVALDLDEQGAIAELTTHRDD
jgi:hypothetical protein